MIYRTAHIAAMVAAAWVLPAKSAHAICDAPRVTYEVSKPSKVWLRTDAHGDWATAGFTPTYSKTKTIQVGASITATASADAGIIFAKVGTSLGVTISGSYAVSFSQSMSKPVPAGKVGRLVMYQEGREFKVSKKELEFPCRYRTVYTTSISAPLRSGDALWRMQLRPPNQFRLEEVDLAVVPKHKKRAKNVSI